MIVAAVFLLASLVNLATIPWHPTWFAVVNLALFVPIAYLAARLAGRPRAQV